MQNQSNGEIGGAERVRRTGLIPASEADIITKSIVEGFRAGGGRYSEGDIEDIIRLASQIMGIAKRLI